MKNCEMKLRYNSPAPLGDDFSAFAYSENPWERYSLPLGNGYFGANVFGRTQTERIQISEPTLSNTWYTPKSVPRNPGSAAAGVNNFAEILIDIGHESVSDYERSLSLEDATARVSYLADGVRYERVIFASHPDKLIAARFSASRSASVSLAVEIKIPFVGEYNIEPEDGFSKSGEALVDGDKIIIKGEMGYYGIKYCGILKVIPLGGTLFASDGKLCVEGADEVIMLFSCDTNYELCEAVFYEKEPPRKLQGKELDENGVASVIERGAMASFDELLLRHTEDYRALYSRVSLNIADASEQDKYTDELLAAHKRGERSPYLHTLLFQYGRYLLISSSRTRLPAHLQGIWNAYSDSPWSCGYWHNINVQMNYWPSGPANLAELFIPYVNYAKAYMKTAREYADNYVKEKYPESFSGEGNNGWIIGTGAGAYRIDSVSKLSHSGPGTGAFTSLLFWDYFDYTRDMSFLRDFAYPALYGMSLFFSKALIECDGKYLIKESASPENRHNGEYYHTVGCAFDQQMVYENFKRTIEAAELLGISDSLIERIKDMLPCLDPVLLGDDGQVKEYREETYYSSIGDPNHRHISHLVGLYPGTIINATTPEWLEGAKVTLTKRGDKSTCWAVAHRLLLWARTKTAHKCRDLIDSFIERNVMDNLWCSHPPFQIDGNFGYAAGVCEMLMQSHAGFIELLPAPLPEWHSGSFEGIVARGSFVVDCEWSCGEITRVKVSARADGVMKIKLPKPLMPEYAEFENSIFSTYMKAGETVEFAIR